tara:strand:+ start:1072 stop:1956 length:885 start_codon:yes stop_codon:yes gene_type:complete
MNKFKGTFSVIVTPFTEDSHKVNIDVLKKYIDWQINEGIHGIVALGSTGEFLSLKEEERYIVAKIVIERANGKVPVLIGTGAENTWDVIRYSKEAESLGADGVMIIPPFYSSPTEVELYHHFKNIADAISIPIMIYNNPATANVDLTPKFVKKLSEIKNISYIKESTMDVTRVREIVNLCEDKMVVFGGIMGYESFLNGAYGWVSVGSNIMPSEFAKIYNLTVVDKDIDAASKLYNYILPAIELVGQHRYTSATKAVLNLMGLNVGPPRPPRLEASGSDFEWVKEVVEKYNLKI